MKEYARLELQRMIIFILDLITLSTLHKIKEKKWN